MTFFKNKSTATYFLWVEVLKMTEWENWFKSISKGIKLPRNTFI
jgi:hypothetical protein